MGLRCFENSGGKIMVYLSIAEEIGRIKKYIQDKGGLELSLYQYLHKQSQTQTINDFSYDEHKIAFKGYSKIVANKEEIDSLINRKYAKGIGYSLNIYCFLGIHLAANGYRNDLVDKKFYDSDIKSKYIISIVFPYFRDKMFQVLKTEEAKRDPYYSIIDTIYNSDDFSLDEIKTVLQQFLTSDNDLDVIDLYILETIHKKNLDVRFCNYSAVDTVLRILNNFSNSIKKITSDRYNKRDGIKINDEYDVQDMLFALLKGFFHDLEREDPVSKLAGRSSRIDLVVRSQGIMIEVKMIKEKDTDHKKVIQELKVDMINYAEWKDLKHLILFTYDPYKKTTDDNHFKELEGVNERNGVRFLVHSVLAH